MTVPQVPLADAHGFLLGTRMLRSTGTFTLQSLGSDDLTFILIGVPFLFFDARPSVAIYVGLQGGDGTGILRTTGLPVPLL